MSILKEPVFLWLVVLFVVVGWIGSEAQIDRQARELDQCLRMHDDVP